MSAPEATPHFTRLNEHQRQMMKLLEDRESIIVHGSYIGDVLSLQAQGLITTRLIETVVGNSKLEIRKAANSR